MNREHIVPITEQDELTIGPARLIYEDFSEHKLPVHQVYFFIEAPEVAEELQKLESFAVNAARKANLFDRKEYEIFVLNSETFEELKPRRGIIIPAMSYGATIPNFYDERKFFVPDAKKEIYSGMHVYATFRCTYKWTPTLGLFISEFILCAMQKESDDEPLSIIFPYTEEARKEVFGESWNKNLAQPEEQDAKTLLNFADSQNPLYNRNYFESALEKLGAINPRKLASVLRAYSTLSSNLTYYKDKSYDKELCEKLIPVFTKDLRFWNSLIDKGYKFYGNTRRILSPSYMLGFVALWVLDDKVEETSVFDYLGQITGKERVNNTITRDLFSQIKNHHRRYGQFPSEDLQNAIMEGWLKFYDEQYKLREAK